MRGFLLSPPPLLSRQIRSAYLLLAHPSEAVDLSRSEALDIVGDNADRLVAWSAHLPPKIRWMSCLDVAGGLC